jgi:formylglycine-generating enzyme required for sulfatase activity
MRILLPIIALLLALPGAVHAEVTIDWVTVGDPGNDCETQTQGCFGAVAYTYQISKYEVTNAQYTEFLNALAATDTYGLYHTSMESGWGGITRTGSPGSFSYSSRAFREDRPVNFVSFWDAVRFANWLHNAQPTGAQDNSTTEDGAYTLTPTGIANNTITRNAGATVFVTSEDEWYKAAYFNGTSYFDYPAGSNTQTTCTVPGAAANTANCGWVHRDPTDVGSYTGSPSPYGTFDQGGNVMEWNEIIIQGSDRCVRGGTLLNSPTFLAASVRVAYDPTINNDLVGFRVASIPEPQIPALPKWGYVALAGGLIVVGAVVMWRRAA